MDFFQRNTKTFYINPAEWCHKDVLIWFRECLFDMVLPTSIKPAVSPSIQIGAIMLKQKGTGMCSYQCIQFEVNRKLQELTTRLDPSSRAARIQTTENQTSTIWKISSHPIRPVETEEIKSQGEQLLLNSIPGIESHRHHRLLPQPVKSSASTWA